MPSPWHPKTHPALKEPPNDTSRHVHFSPWGYMGGGTPAVLPMKTWPSGTLCARPVCFYTLFKGALEASKKNLFGYKVKDTC